MKDLYQLKVLFNVQVSERYWHMKVEAGELARKMEAGQFFNIKCTPSHQESYHPFLMRPFSVYRINPEEETLEFLYLTAGLGTFAMTEIKAGDRAEMLGPLGIGFTVNPSWKGILVLARGVGIATLAALVQKAAIENIPCTAILSARSQNDLLATEMLKSYGTTIHLVTDEDGSSDVERVERLMDEIFTTTEIEVGFTCGSNRLAKLMQRKLKERNLAGQIALEENMACGLGYCYACVCHLQENDGPVKAALICKDGPVFDLAKVVLS